MSFRSTRRSTRLLFRSCSLLFACLGMALFTSVVFAPSSAQAGYYQMVLCAANNGSNSFQTATNTAWSGNPGGIFNFENYCGPAPFPAGNNAFLRIDENQASGTAGYSAYGSVSWTVPPWVAIVAGGGYTREAYSFNDGWFARFWVEGWDGSTNNIVVQGPGAEYNGACGGVCWKPCSAFCSHLWPFGGYGDYRRFVVEMTCWRQAGCDKANFNAFDANTMILTLADRFDSQVGWSGNTPFMQSQWTRGNQTATFTWNELGSGIRMEWINIDGNRRWTIDHQATGECNRDFWGGVGEFARVFTPCAQALGIGRAYTFDTASLADGAHTMTACTQDYSQWYSNYSSCTNKTILTDNSAPGAPPNLKVETANLARYLPNMAAKFSLPPNSGSPITRVHYVVVNAAGAPVQPEQVVSGTNPTELKSVVGPKTPGEYRLKVWLEDQVGFSSPPSFVAIPHDTVPPAAPQDVSVAAPDTSKAADGFDVKWRNIVDAGSPINAVHYEVLNAAGEVVVPAKTVSAQNISSIADIEAPKQSGDFTLRLWLSDEEGNVGASATAPLSYRCVRSDVSAGQQLTAGLDGAQSRVVKQGEGATLGGVLQSEGAPVANVPICIFSNVVTDSDREFLGLAITGKDGGYRFGIPPGPSRNLIAVYRPGHRELSAQAKVETVVHPSFNAKTRVIRNKKRAYFSGDIPGPHNDRVVVVLQARLGKGWIAFRRYRTRDGGHFALTYRFHSTMRPTTYVMRAQVRQTTGYPYLQGNSDRLKMRVLPAKRAHARR